MVGAIRQGFKGGYLDEKFELRIWSCGFGAADLELRISYTRSNFAAEMTKMI